MIMKYHQQKIVVLNWYSFSYLSIKATNQLTIKYKGKLLSGKVYTKIETEWFLLLVGYSYGKAGRENKTKFFLYNF